MRNSRKVCNLISMNSEDKRKFTAFLEEYVTSERRGKMNKVLDSRTDYITVALEDIYQSHNASAVLRSCDAFGIQDVHIIENRNKYRINPGVALGSSGWLTLNRYNSGSDNSLDAVTELKKRGYRIIATMPYDSDVDLEEFDLEKGKCALFFGTEMHGLSDTVLSRADGFMKIPMFGFVESFNISVSCAISLHHLTWSLRRSSIPWQLTPERKADVYLDWLRKSVRNSSLYEKIFFNRLKDK